MLTYNALFNIVALSTAICRASAVADPSKVFFTVGAYGFGDWGKSLDDASCCSGDHTFYDVQAQKTVATLMDIYAGQNGLPNVLLAHGDNFYWTGINSESDIIPRFTTSYENVYNGQNIRNIPTLATLGNHDMGGADYICSKDDKLVPCTSEKELTEGLFNKAFWQSKYESPNNKRWHMEGRYFTYWIEGMDHVSIEVFNLDTNDADVAGMKSVCCQCQGYAKAKKKYR